MPPPRKTYREIADEIESRIHKRQLLPGDELPSAAGLGVAFGVSKATGERALALLRDRGLTEGVVGVGTFVATNAGGSRSSD